MTLKIGHFLNWCDEGGTVGMILSLIQNSRHEHIYVTYGANERRIQQFKELGIELIQIGNEYMGAAIDVMVKEKVDVVHASSSGGPNPGVEIGLKAKKPIVETCQSPDLPAGSRFSTCHVVPVSHGITKYWHEKEYTSYSRVIYSCAEPVKQMDKAIAKTAMGLDPDHMVVGRLGRLESIKRPSDFVQAAYVLAQMQADCQFLLVGNGHDFPYIENAVAAFNSEHPHMKMVLPGNLFDEMKVAAFNAMDVLLYPTTMEGFGIVFTEAMSVGLPIVTYSDYVNLDVVGAGGVFAIDNLYTDVKAPYHSLARLTLDLLQNDRDRERIGKRGQQRYYEMFQPSRMAEQYDVLYEEIV